MHYIDPTNKLFIFIGWWASYPPFFKGNLEKTYSFIFCVILFGWTWYYFLNQFLLHKFLLRNK